MASSSDILKVLGFGFAEASRMFRVVAPRPRESVVVQAVVQRDDRLAHGDSSDPTKFLGAFLGAKSERKEAGVNRCLSVCPGGAAVKRDRRRHLFNQHLCERLFSQCKLVMTPQRASLLPVNFEMIVFLLANLLILTSDTHSAWSVRSLRDSDH
ncbi:hypothetical protein PC112_g22085 [Phytophthora cactorum]|nr:hypothetical protein PC112_g22085 [Phytophthora cactorum]